MLADVVTGELVKLPGVSRTQTMVAFEVFSRHDLEAMFSIGRLSGIAGASTPAPGAAALAERRRASTATSITRPADDARPVQPPPSLSRAAETAPPRRLTAMSVVRPEFGPTLPELLAPRVRALPRAAQVALAVLAALVVVLAALFVLRRRGDDGRCRPSSARRSPTTSLYPPPLERVAPRGRETLRLQTPAGDRGAAVVRRHAVQAPALQGRRDGHPHAARRRT